ncbi:uncharacterized protein BDV17DRAFT_279059 [Aspergillus undulatus]|uniref:uncharacterized protein n=1 Tax=Aspergillus undulatus TaxID=1810928 RepID=UPI003CCE108F
MKGDQKICHEVAVMQFPKNNTSIPVRSIIAWGLANENPLGIGPFILMEFVEGQPLDEIPVDRSNESEGIRILRSNISNGELEIIYRLVANILLELSAHEFPRIGSLSLTTDTVHEIETRSLTLKINEIESHGGVCVGEHRPEAFHSVSEYFHNQNLVDDAEGARAKYEQHHAAKGIFTNFYALFAAAWLLIKKPFDWDDLDLDRSSGAPTANMATLMRDSIDDGKFWFHELIYSCFEGPDNRAWKSVQGYHHSPSDSITTPQHDVDIFVKDKMEQLAQYNEEWAAMEQELERKRAEFEALRRKVEQEDRQMGNIE